MTHNERSNALFPGLGLLPERQLKGDRSLAGQVREAVEGGEKGQLDGKSTGARIGKGRKMSYNALISNL